MKDFIEKLIERLEELPTKAITRYKGGAFGDYEGTDYFIDKYKTKDIINELAEEHNNGWIPCSERLPETNKGVLVCTNEGQVDVDYYGEYTKDFIGLKGTEQYAIAWQPLPAPYKEGEQSMKDGVHPQEYEIKRKQTNADRIRSMTDEELAELFTKLAWNSEVQTTPLKYLEWLQSEVEGE